MAYWEKEKKLGEVDLGTGKKFVLSLNHRKDITFISFKGWWETDGGDWAPEKKQGINIAVEVFEEMVPIIEKGLQEYHEEFGDEFSLANLI